MTQGDLAAKMGQTQTWVSKCERGQRRIDIIELRSLCKALGIEIGRFLRLLDAQTGQ